MHLFPSYSVLQVLNDKVNKRRKKKRKEKNADSGYCESGKVGSNVVWVDEGHTSLR